ncbi:MAG: cytidylate kinase family protein [Patescibacteria group bacterium]|jgi:cytidylate kinase
MIISLSGANGSGKSTLSQKLSDKLGWPRYSMGTIRREAALKQGLSLAEYNKIGEQDPQNDRIVDEYQKELGKTQDNFIIDGRTSWYFIPHSLKIYLDVAIEVGAQRVWKDIQERGQRENEDKNIRSYEDALKSLKQRRQSDTDRYQKYYNIDVNDKKHYDYYLDATDLTPEEAFDRVYDFVKSHIDKS